MKKNKTRANADSPAETKAKNLSFDLAEKLDKGEVSIEEALEQIDKFLIASNA